MLRERRRQFAFAPLVLAAAVFTIALPLHSARNRSLGPSQVSVTIGGSHRIIESNGLPDHEPGEFPRRGNPNAIQTQAYQFRIPLRPEVNLRATPSNFAYFGVALNGVPFEPGTAEFWNGDRQWNYEAKSGAIDLGLDEHDAHVQPNGAYHYHGLPTGLIKRLGGDEKTMRLIGYAADGFPIYTDRGYSDPRDTRSGLKKMRSSYRLKSGRRAGGPGGAHDGTFTADYEYQPGSGDLDECNGRFGVTPEHPQGIYHYYVTDEFPYIGRQWRGTPDSSFMKRAMQPGPPFPGFGGGPPGHGPRRPPHPPARRP